MKFKPHMNRVLSVLLSMIIIMGISAVGGGFAVAAAETDSNPFAAQDEEYVKSIENSTSMAGVPSADAPSMQAQQFAASAEVGSNHYNLKFKSDYSSQAIYDMIKDCQYEIIGDSSNSTFTIASEDDLSTMESRFGEYCEYVEQDIVYVVEDTDDSSLTPDQIEGITELSLVPNDTYYTIQWYLDTLEVPAAWDYTTGSASTYVAVIDSGIYRSHPDLIGSDIRSGLDIVRTGAVNVDVSGHGTSVTGVIAATMNNSRGIAGIAPGVAIIPFCVEDDAGDIYSSDVASALYAAADIGCKVINMSLGSVYISTTIRDAVAYAYNRGCIIVASAGNDKNSTYNYPASCEGVISVGSVDKNSEWSYFSNYNDMVDVAAPGEDIYTTLKGSGYGYRDGTSFSSPCVAGVAALAVTLDPSITPADFAELLRTTSTDIGAAGYDKYTGSGIVNASSILSTIAKIPIITYECHVQDIGWQGWVKNGAVAGTSGESKRLEAIYIQLANVDGGVEYKTHVQDIGWMGWVADGDLSGTSGASKRLEAIQIRLTGAAADIYDIYYCVHAQNFGWMDWAKNGEPSGTAGYGYRLEAIKILLVQKGGAAPGSTTLPYKDYYTQPLVSYQTHVQDIGWQGYVSNGIISGTSGESKRLEAIQIKLRNIDGGIEYSTHVQDYGWMPWSANDAISGTSGQSKRLEAIQIRLTGAAADIYDIYYCVHAQNTGWLDWAKNGEPAGTTGFSYRLEAIKIVLVPKGGAAPGSTARPFAQA